MKQNVKLVATSPLYLCAPLINKYSKTHIWLIWRWDLDVILKNTRTGISQTLFDDDTWNYNRLLRKEWWMNAFMRRSIDLLISKLRSGRLLDMCFCWGLPYMSPFSAHTRNENSPDWPIVICVLFSACTMKIRNVGWIVTQFTFVVGGNVSRKLHCISGGRQSKGKYPLEDSARTMRDTVHIFSFFDHMQVF